MSARRGHGRRRRGGHAAEHENEERWLLTYSDMITLLMALFMVLFSITSVNKSKLQVLTKVLQQAFSGQILPGGRAIMDSGGGPQTHEPAPTPPIPAIQPLVASQSTPTGMLSHGSIAAAAAAASAAAAATAAGAQSASAVADRHDFTQLKHQIDSYVRSHGLSGQVQTVISERGLIIRLLTDRVLFDSGQAQLKPESGPLLGEVAQLLKSESGGRQIMVEGHTDNIPISGSQYPTNWELSTARASRVVRFLIDAGVSSGQLSAVGYASLHPMATNSTAAGRSRNRRVEIVLLRSGQGAAQGGAAP